jgi:hypothetical protein
MVMPAIGPYSKMIEPAIIAWLITLIIVWLIFKLGRDILGAILLKLHEVFIQRSPVKL